MNVVWVFAKETVIKPIYTKIRIFTHFDRYKTNKYLVEDSQCIKLLWFEEGVKNRWPFINVVNFDDSSFS